MKSILHFLALLFSISTSINQASAQLTDGSYYIRVVDSDKYLRLNGNDMATTHDQIEDEFSIFRVTKLSNDKFLIKVVANEENLHIDISTDSRLSTRFNTPDSDNCSQFILTRLANENFRIRVACREEFTLSEDSGGFVSALNNTFTAESQFSFEPFVSFPEHSFQRGNGLFGHVRAFVSESPRSGDGYGFSFYISVYPLIENSFNNFQIGLPSTWVIPDNRFFNKQLCPPGTFGGDNWPHLKGEKFQFHFQTMEGGVGYWGSSRFPTRVPKYRINGTPNCYTHEISSPGWGFTDAIPLTCDEMGLAQLSNRILIPPDGLNFEEDTNGEILGTAWMAMPFTTRKGYYRLQTESMESNQCLQGNQSGVVTTETISESSLDQLFFIEDRHDGYVRLEHTNNEITLEGAQVLPGASFGGAARMQHGNETGKWWKMISVGEEYYQLTNFFLEGRNKCLELDDASGRAFMKDCEANPSPQQKWKFTGVTHNNVTPVGDKSWTLFMNAQNFKGPLAFWIPDTWSKVSIGHDSLAARGLDARPMHISQGSMEVNTIPYFMEKTDAGEIFTKIPKMEFPVNVHNETPLMMRISYYDASSVYTDVKKWFDGGSMIKGPFNWSFIGPNVQPGDISLTQGENKVPVDFDDIVTLSRPTGINSSYGFDWVSRDDAGTFPQYYKKSFGRIKAIRESDVPDNIGLKEKTFEAKPPLSDFSIIDQNIECYGSLTASTDLDTVLLNDGTRVVYTWYRFVDQPSLHQYNLSTTAKNSLQEKVNKIHRNWSITDQYLPGPGASLNSTNLVSFDENLLVTPPPGKEVGFVPIVLKQEKVNSTD